MLNKTTSRIITSLMLLGLAALVANFGSSTSGASNSVYLSQEKFIISPLPDSEQYNNPSVPVVVVRTVSGIGESEEKKKAILIKEVIVENRSSKSVASITLSWKVSPINDRLTHLNRGILKPHVLSELHKKLLAGNRQTLKTTHPSIKQMLSDIPNLESMGNEFAILMGVDEVVFSDGTTWKESPTDVSTKSENR